MANHRRKPRPLIGQLKRCARCLEEQDLSCFGKSKRGSAGRDSYCYACRVLRTAEWQQANPEKTKAKAQRIYTRHRERRVLEARIAYALKADRVQAAQRAKYASNAEHRADCIRRAHQVRQEKPEMVSAWGLAYRKKNRPKLNTLSAEYRALKANAEGRCTHEDWLSILREHDYRCAYCLEPENVVGCLARDHMLPLSRGGTNHPVNIVPACKSCNCTKNNRTPLEFIAGLSKPKSKRIQSPG